MQCICELFRSRAVSLPHSVLSLLYSAPESTHAAHTPTNNNNKSEKKCKFNILIHWGEVECDYDCAERFLVRDYRFAANCSHFRLYFFASSSSFSFYILSTNLGQFSLRSPVWQTCKRKQINSSIENSSKHETAFRFRLFENKHLMNCEKK